MAFPERYEHRHHERKRLRVSEALTAGYYDGIEKVTELKQSPFYNLLLNAYGRLRTEFLYRRGIHGPSHVERVMLLAAIIAMEQGFTGRETELLLIACSYHDIGRINDDKDDQHGKRSADQLPSIPGLEISEGELRCLQAAIATHSRKDAFIDFFICKYEVSDEDTDLCRLLCKALKDADNLDRVRLGDLDVGRLRFAESKALEETAEAIFETKRYEKTVTEKGSA